MYIKKLYLYTLFIIWTFYLEHCITFSSFVAQQKNVIDIYKSQKLKKIKNIDK